MIETIEKIIDGKRYSITQMTARRALRMKAKLLKTFGSSLAEIFLPSKEEPIEGLGFSKKEAVNALSSLALQLDDNTFDSLITELLSGVRKEGVELTESVIDFEFAGELFTLFKVIWAVLEVNYGSFFGKSGIGSLLQEEEEIPQQTTKKTSIKKL